MPGYRWVNGYTGTGVKRTGNHFWEKNPGNPYPFTRQPEPVYPPVYPLPEPVYPLYPFFLNFENSKFPPEKKQKKQKKKQKICENRKKKLKKQKKKKICENRKKKTEPLPGPAPARGTRHPYPGYPTPLPETGTGVRRVGYGSKFFAPAYPCPPRPRTLRRCARPTRCPPRVCPVRTWGTHSNTLVQTDRIRIG